jgi:3-deoxy-D-manno-octulosonic acid (KDO) 8-phosphate synthase
MAVCTQEEKDILKAPASARIAYLFKGLGGSQQMKILKKLASSVGVKLDTSVGDISGNGEDASDVSDPFDIPDSLNRTEKKKGRSRRKGVSSSPVSE